MSSAKPWFVEAFRAEYVDIYPLRDLESARREAQFLVAQGLAGRVLDLCCGFGRHSLALRELGVDVIGVDLSIDLLMQARSLPHGEWLEGRLLLGDARRVPLRDASLDGIVNLFSSFGYFGDDGDAQALDEVARMLRRDGVVFFDLMNPARVRERFVPESHTARDGFVLDERRTLSTDGQRVAKEVRLSREGFAPRTWREDVRMYEPPEMAVLLEGRRLEVIRTFGDFDGSPFSPAAPRQIIQARKVYG